MLTTHVQHGWNRRHQLAGTQPLPSTQMKLGPACAASLVLSNGSEDPEILTRFSNLDSDLGTTRHLSALQFHVLVFLFSCWWQINRDG